MQKLVLTRLPWCLSFLCAAAPILAQPQYYVSPRYYNRGAGLFRHVADNRTLTAVGRERDWSNGGAYTGNLLMQRTTGAFSPQGVPEVNEYTIPPVGAYSKVLNSLYKGFRMPVTAEGHTLLWVGNTDSVLGPTQSGGAIWKADDSVVPFSAINGSDALVPRDMNESLVSVGYILHDYLNLYDQERKRAEPVLISASGAVSIIEPSRVAGYGYEAPDDARYIWDVVMDNAFKAVAINNQAAVVCDGHGSFYTESNGHYHTEDWSFVSKNGSIVVAQLPAGATDINDLGEVVGYNYPQGTWLYLPSPHYGLPAGVNIIDTVLYTDGWDTRQDVLNIQPLINNQGTVAWRGTYFTVVGAPTYPNRIWKNGTAYDIATLFDTDEVFSIQQIVEMNENSDLLVWTTYTETYEGETFEAFGCRILSPTPFQSEIVVNVTDDLSDADPDDDVIDIDTDKTGLQVSLRAAIDAVNEGLSDSIKFDIPGASVPVIILTKALPAIMRPVTIDGTSQSVGQVEIRGGAHSGAGFQLQGGASEVRGMVMHGFTGVDAAAIRISGPGGNRIVNNHLGTDASGTSVQVTQFGVLIEGSPDNEIGGESEDEGNVLYGETACVGIKLVGSDNNLILGNHIGIGSSGQILTPLAGTGIAQTEGNGTVIGRSGRGGNWIAASIGISISGDAAISSLTIAANRIGLDGTGTAAANGFAGILLAGIQEASLTDVTVSDNQLAGHLFNLLLVGQDGLSDVTIQNNDIGLAFDGSGNLPTGLEEGQQGYGIRLDGASDVSVSGNMVAGHTWNILASGIIQFYVFGGEDTDGDGEPDANFQFSLLNPADSEHPGTGETAASGIQITNNHVGVDRSGRIPSGIIQLTGIASYGSAQGTVINDNLIGGNTEYGVWVESGSDIHIKGNHIGVTGSGLPIQNGVGVIVDQAAATLTDNIIARNTLAGVAVTDEDAVMSLTGGSLYGNGNGLGPKGIFYDAEPFSAPERLFVFRTAPDDSNNSSVVFAIPTIGGLTEDAVDEAETLLEIWGNRNEEETQGYTRLLSQVIDPSKPFAKGFVVSADSFYVAAQNFTATLTRTLIGAKWTSTFSQAVEPERIVLPELELSLDTAPGVLGFQWPASSHPGLFAVEEASSPNGPWHIVDVGPVRDGDNMTVSLPVGTGNQYFRLAMNPDGIEPRLRFVRTE